MLPEKKTKANIGVGIGVVIQLAGLKLFGPADIRTILAILLSLPVFIWGCMNYAEGKGQSKWVGLVGLAGIVGLVVLIVLPDEHKGGGIGVRLVGWISMLAGFAIVLIGRWLWRLKEHAALERVVPPWWEVCMLSGMLLGACLVVASLVLLCTDFGRSKRGRSRAPDEQIAAEPKVAPPDLPPDAPSSSET
jgi:hypothetical protein